MFVAVGNGAATGGRDIEDMKISYTNCSEFRMIKGNV
jgi:hypothetical protein